MNFLFSRCCWCLILILKDWDDILDLLFRQLRVLITDLLFGDIRAYLRLSSYHLSGWRVLTWKRMGMSMRMRMRMRLWTWMTWRLTIIRSDWAIRLIRSDHLFWCDLCNFWWLGLGLGFGSGWISYIFNIGHYISLLCIELGFEIGKTQEVMRCLEFLNLRIILCVGVSLLFTCILWYFVYFRCIVLWGQNWCSFFQRFLLWLRWLWEMTVGGSPSWSSCNCMSPIMKLPHFLSNELIFKQALIIIIISLPSLLQFIRILNRCHIHILLNLILDIF